MRFLDCNDLICQLLTLSLLLHIEIFTNRHNMSFENGMRKLSLQSVDYDLDLVPTLDLNQLSQLKSLIEKNLYGFYDELKSLNCDLDTPLLTGDGFPRSDIDVVQVRLLRTQIIMLQNDYKSILRSIEDKFQSHFSNSNNNITSKGTKANKIPSESLSIPFATVSQVVNGSPSETAGLKLGDKIISIGHINVTNHDNLKTIPPLVKDHLERNLNLVVKRDENGESGIVNIVLVPSANWGGQGILGCKLDQI